MPLLLLIAFWRSESANRISQCVRKCLSTLGQKNAAYSQSSNKGEKHRCAHHHLHSRKPFRKPGMCRRDGGWERTNWWNEQLVLPVSQSLRLVLPPYSGPGLTKIPMRMDLAANGTTCPSTPFHTPSAGSARGQKLAGVEGFCPAVTVAEATMKETAGRNVRLIWGLQTFLHDCPLVVFCLTLLSPLVSFTDETDSATGTDGGPRASKRKRLAMTQTSAGETGPINLCN